MRSSILADGLSESTISKLSKLKERDGYTDKTWGEWFTYKAQDVSLVDSPAEMIQKGTRENLLEMWCQNLANNLPHIKTGESISALVPEECKLAEKEGKSPDFPTGPAIVIGRGPNVYAKKHMELLAGSDYAGTVVCSDGALIDVLKAGVDPSRCAGFYSVSVDGHRDLIAKWYDHELVDKYGPHIKAILCSSVAPNVRERCEKAGVKVHYFHPLYDDHRNIESFTKIQMFLTKSEKHPNGVPSVMAGGNAGACSWVLSWLVMRKSPVALIGLDYGYRPEDNLESTYYWKSMLQQYRGDISQVMKFYERIHNPDFDVDGVVDPVFKHYREAFLSMVMTTPDWVNTVNCTEGGVLFGPRIRSMKFADFLERWDTI